MSLAASFSRCAMTSASSKRNEGSTRGGSALTGLSGRACCRRGPFAPRIESFLDIALADELLRSFRVGFVNEKLRIIFV